MQWDEAGWHYCADAATGGPLTCQYIFVLDALNFCFWCTKDYEYDTLATSLTRVLTADPHAFDAERLVAVDAATLGEWMGNPAMHQLDERVAKLQEARAARA